MGMSKAAHRSSNHHKIMKAVGKCSEIREIRKTRKGWIFFAINGEVFNYHPTAKAPRKLTSFLRQNTKIGEQIIRKVCSV
jgi:hypothetical protein